MRFDILILIRPVIISLKILTKWANIFERNSISTGIILNINSRKKEEILVALSETIEDIGEPLKQYISSKSYNDDCFDVQINEFNFEILIDKNTLKQPEAIF